MGRPPEASESPGSLEVSLNERCELQDGVWVRWIRGNGETERFGESFILEIRAWGVKKGIVIAVVIAISKARPGNILLDWPLRGDVTIAGRRNLTPLASTA